MTKYDDKEFWRDESAWRSPALTIDGRKLIFLLKALDDYGLRSEPGQWPQIEAVYKDPTLYVASSDARDWPRVSQSIYELLHSWDYSFKSEFHSEPFEYSEGCHVVEDWCDCTDQDKRLAESIARYCKKINPEHAKLHQRILDNLTEAFASGRLTAYRVKLDILELTALTPEAWHGAKAVTDKRFFFGEVALDLEGRVRDAEKGPYQLYVDEAEFASFLDRVSPPPVTIEAWLEAQIRHYDRQPKSVCANKVDCKKEILQDPRTKKFNMNGIGVKIEAAFQKVKPQLVRFGKTGVKTGTRRTSK
jgi:hypothetical protein